MQIIIIIRFVFIIRNAVPPFDERSGKVSTVGDSKTVEIENVMRARRKWQNAADRATDATTRSQTTITRRRLSGRMGKKT